MGSFQSSEPLSEELYHQKVASLPDLSGKVVAITGSTTGMGSFAAQAAVTKGAQKVLLLNRPSERATKAEELVRKVAEDSGSKSQVKTVPCNLQSVESVKQCAKALLDECPDGLDVLCNNAGIMAMQDTRTQDGYDVQMQTNQLSHALLTKLAMPKLEQAASTRGEARVVFHSSSIRDAPPSNLDPAFFRVCEPSTLGGDTSWLVMDFMSGGPWSRYHQTKLANSAFAMALHEELATRGSKVKAMACDPGLAKTELQATSENMSGFSTTMFNAACQSGADGSMPLIHCCFDAAAESGDFYLPQNGRVGPVTQSIRGGVPVKPGTEKLTTSKDNQRIAWEESLQFPGVAPFFAE